MMRLRKKDTANKVSERRWGKMCPDARKMVETIFKIEKEQICVRIGDHCRLWLVRSSSRIQGCTFNRRSHGEESGHVSLRGCAGDDSEVREVMEPTGQGIQECPVVYHAQYEVADQVADKVRRVHN